MPMYLYRCAECGAAHDHYARISEIDANIPDCHGPMERQIGTPMFAIQADMHAKSPIDGTVLTSRRQRLEYMKRNGLTEALPANEQIRAGQARKAEIERAAAQLPGVPEHVKRQLFKEAGFPG